MSAGASPPRGGAGAVDFVIFETIGFDPTVAPGLDRPVGWRVGLADGSKAWDKFGTGSTQWSLVASGTGAVATVQGLAGALTIQVVAPHLGVGTTGGNTIVIGGTSNASADATNWATRTAWFCDPSNATGLASNSNTGADAGHPILDLSEVAGRTWGNTWVPGSPCLITLMSDMPAGKSAHFATIGIGAPGGTIVNPFSANSWLMIVGTPTVTYTGTGTVAAPATLVLGPNAGDNHFTDGAAPAFATGNVIYTRTNGTVARAWPLKDLGGGGRRTSQWISGNSAATLTAGDSWTISTLPILRNVVFSQTADPNQYLVALVSEQSTSTVARPNRVRWVCCAFTSNSPILHGAELINCSNLVNRFASTTDGIPPTTIRGGGTIGALSFASGATYFAATSAGIYHSTQGSGATVGLGLVDSTRVVGINWAFYDCGDMVQVADACADLVTVNMMGTGNTGKFVNVLGAAPGNRVVANSTLPNAAVTSDANPWKVNTDQAATPLIFTQFNTLGSFIANGQV